MIYTEKRESVVYNREGRDGDARVRQSVYNMYSIELAYLHYSTILSL